MSVMGFITTFTGQSLSVSVMAMLRQSEWWAVEMWLKVLWIQAVS